MTWRPSKDKALCREESNLLWRAIEGIVDEAVSTKPLPRYDLNALLTGYTEQRGLPSSAEVSSMLGRIPKPLRLCRLGVAEIELLELLLQVSPGRLIMLRGTRGAGKTSLIHYVEALCCEHIPDQAPLFAKIDGLDIRSADGIQGIAPLIGRALRELSPHAPDKARQFARIQTHFKNCSIASDMRDAVERSLKVFPEHLRARLVIVFDNLDHLSSSTIEEAVEIAQICADHSRVRVVVCLRPQPLAVVSGRSSHGATLHFAVNVPAPNVRPWLARLGERLKREAANRIEAGISPAFRDVPLTADELEKIGEKIRDLLTGRRPDDDVLEILQTVAADDTRALVRLLRRVLEHRSLPAAALMGESQLQPGAFHPLPALFEGVHTLFVDGALVPNLLALDRSEDSPKLLIFQRILLLVQEDAIALTTLLKQLTVLAYSSDHVYEALKRLCNSQLIRCIDSEVFDTARPPSGVYITDAGKYYRDRFLSSADYLLAAVMDVSLEHKALRRVNSRLGNAEAEKGAVDFISASHSLIEYIAEVREKEARQIFRMTKAKNSQELQSVAFRIRKGGIYLQSMSSALQSLIERNQNSPNSKIRDLANAFTELKKDVEQTTATLVDKLREIENKSRGTSLDQDNQMISVDIGQQAVDLSLNYDIAGMVVKPKIAESGSPPDYYFIAVTNKSESGVPSFAQADIAYRRENGRQPPTRNLVYFGSRSMVFPPAPTTESPPHMSVQGVRVESTRRRSVALLYPSFQDGKLRVRMKVPTTIQHPLDESEIGSGLAEPDVQRLVARAREEAACITGTQLDDALLRHGMILANKLLSPTGRNLFVSSLSQVDTLVVFLAPGTEAIPWEWMRIHQAGGSVGSSTMLNQDRRIIRWSADLFDAIYSLPESFEEVGAAPLSTIGLRRDKSKPWRRTSPQGFSKFSSILEDSGVLHLVGHFDGETFLIGQNGTTSPLRLTAELVGAMPAQSRSRVVVLSGCGTGAASNAKNLALAFAQRLGYCVWAPLVDIDERHVDALDAALMQFLRPQSPRPLEAFFTDAKIPTRLPAVYARFGFGTAPELSARTL